MELTVWTAGDRPAARAVDGAARLEVQLPAGEGTAADLDLIARELWGKLDELRRVLRGEF